VGIFRDNQYSLEEKIITAAQYRKRGWEYQLAEVDGQMSLQGQWVPGANLYACK
jgi:hypothetical protein